MKYNNLDKANYEKRSCIYCDKMCTLANINKHEKSCKKNPNNLKSCPVCNILHSKNGVTCSYACSNTYYRSGINNPNWKDEAYRTTCFFYHEKICIVCGEINIVSVHHYNNDHYDNRPENLVPLCPTHHQYVHSSFYAEIKNVIDEYVKNFIIKYYGEDNIL